MLYGNDIVDLYAIYVSILSSMLLPLNYSMLLPLNYSILNRALYFDLSAHRGEPPLAGADVPSFTQYLPHQSGTQGESSNC